MAHPLIEELRKATRAQSARRPVEPPEPREPAEGAPEPGGRRGPFGWLSMLVVVALVAAGWLLIRQFQADARLQDCVMSGRKNCVPLEVSPAPPGIERSP
jgi:hypothetical protein